MVQEFRQKYTEFLSQTFRLFNDSRHLETEITIQPLPLTGEYGNLGKEVITRFITPLETEELFFTDANGMVMENSGKKCDLFRSFNNASEIIVHRGR